MVNNMSDTSIAIIVSAYNAGFLGQALNSLAAQTDKNFTIYIGENHSLSDLASIIEPFKEQLQITYVRFDENLGQEDLIAHWNRCLNLLNDEEYFIIFSDDDKLESDGVPRLKESIIDFNEDIFHFNLQIIDKDGNYIGNTKKYPSHITSLAFFKTLYNNLLDARMLEFVFNTAHFKQEGSFVNFKDVFRSDNSTVIKCGCDKGIRKIDGSRILWRVSGINISRSMASASVDRYIDLLNSIVSFFIRKGYRAYIYGANYIYSRLDVHLDYEKKHQIF